MNLNYLISFNFQVHCLQTLLSSGCDLSLVDHSGDTAARVAEIYGQEECMKVIRECEQKQGQPVERETPSHCSQSGEPSAHSE